MLQENISAKKIVERFTRHLNKMILGIELSLLLIYKQCQFFNNDTPIIVDESDIVKKEGKKMEGLQYLRDGSTGETNKLGYHLLNIISVDKNANSYNIKPISSDLISTDMDKEGIVGTLEKRMVEIALVSGNKGVYIFDRGFDRRKSLSLSEIIK